MTVSEIDIRSEIIRKIEDFKSQIKSYEAALHSLDKTDLAKLSGPEMRFYQMRPLDACRMVLRESGKTMPQEKLIEVMVAGGLIVGKKRGRHNARISIEMTLKTGTLKEMNGLIGLPDWDDSMFTPH